MRTPDVYVSGLGSYIPETVPVGWAVENGMYPAEEVDLHRLAGAAVAGETPPPEMALAAGQEALKRCGRDPADLAMLLYCSSWYQGPEGWLPHSYLQRHLVGGEVPATEVRQGCNGVFTALELGASVLRAEPGREAVMIVAADNFGTPLMDRWRMGPGYIGGDAASAVVLTKEPGFARLLSVCSVTVPEAEQLHRGDEPLFPPGITLGRGADFATRGEEFRLRAAAAGEGTTAFFTIQLQLVSVIDRALEEAGIGRADIGRVAFMHYAHEIVEQRCMAPLGLPMSKSTWEFGRTIGHCGASDQILALDHLVTTGELGPGDHLLSIGTGPGVTLSCSVIKVLDAPPWTR